MAVASASPDAWITVAARHLHEAVLAISGFIAPGAILIGGSLPDGILASRDIEHGAGAGRENPRSGDRSWIRWCSRRRIQRRRGAGAPPFDLSTCAVSRLTALSDRSLLRCRQAIVPARSRGHRSDCGTAAPVLADGNRDDAGGDGAAPSAAASSSRPRDAATAR